MKDDNLKNMKNLAKSSLWLLITGMMMIATVGFSEQKKNSPDSQMLVVERQYAKLDGYSSFDWMEIVVDVPIKGPRPLVDSINAFLNTELYSMLEIEDDFKRFSAKEVYTDDMSNLVTTYADKYREYLKEHLEWFATYNLFVISQTESFVTYGIECYHGAGSTGSEFVCRTFSKKDGHRVEIIASDDLLRFYEDHQEIEIPEILNWELKSEDGFSWNPFEVGLVDDGMLIGNVTLRTHYEQDFFPYSDILPYLSKDAQNLVKHKGKSSKWEECFVGERLAKVNTSDNHTIVFAVRPAEHDWSDTGDCIDSGSDDYGMTNNLCYDGHDLMAFYVGNEEYTPANVLGGESVLVRDWDVVFSTNPSKDAFSYDTAIKRLFVTTKLRKENLLGTVTTNNGKTINLWECTSNGIYTVAAFANNNGKDEEVAVFKVKDGYQSFIESVHINHWCGTNPKETFFAFNAADNTLYIPLIEKDGNGYDRYIVYRFDGEHFVYKTKDGGFWLHPSLRKFERNVGVCRTTDYLIRVDYLGDDTYRYAAWKNKTDWKDQSSKPNIIIGDGYLTRAHTGMSDYLYRFENKGYSYCCMADSEVLEVFHGEKLILSQSIIDCLGNK